ncbi:unnamed protein product [Rotaria sordida]|uniref:Uncharacterized protein n=1 Tax=Rotaria sordida TaxID=392033 RepID=A0A814BAU1_9BILA|nr:unnamed protein product [Rotaria sordida]CAF0924201.1 unnamed protein product [Rotaria sordida]
MCDKISASILTLPIELVYRILDNLNDLTILCSVRNVCTRLNAITDTYHRYQTLTTLEFRWHQLQEQEIQHLANVLIGNTTITTLNLYNTPIGDQGMQYLANALADNRAITTLNLYDARIGDQGMQYLADALANNRTLTMIDLSNNKIQDQGAHYLANALTENTTLTTLSLYNDQIGDQEGQHFANTLRNNTILTTLILSNNRIEDLGAQHIATALISNKTLITLSLQGNLIGNRGAHHLGNALTNNKTLITLNLQDNLIAAEGAQHLTNALINNTTLTTLQLRGNGVGVKGTQHLANALTNNMALTTLNLRGNGIEVEGVQYLAVALTNNTTLTTLNLGYNGIRDSGAQYLANSLSSNTTLTTLALTHNRIGDEGAQHIANALKNNTTLTTLDLSRNEIQDQGVEHIANALTSNMTLITLSVATNRIGEQGQRRAIEILNGNKVNKATNSPRQSIQEYRFQQRLAKIRQKMVIATAMPTNSRTREQMTETIENDTIQNISSEIKENDSDKATDNHIRDNNNNQNGISTISIDAVRDSTSTTSSTRQQTPSSTTKDEYKYTGDIYEDKKHGKGILTWSDGQIYTGAFFADRRHGFGISHNPNISEFKGLYCHDERFGPGILIYESLQCADVGLWLNEDLIRLLYSHPKLTIDIHITDKKSLNSSSLIIPSWYSPHELLSTIYNHDYLLKKKSPTLFCNNIQDENSLLTRYIIEHVDRVQETMQDKREQLNAYLSSIYEKNDEQILKNKILKERTPDILPPNETHEQQQLYYYVNKFWPFKQRASFPIEDIFSNTRSSFPNPGPLENASLNLFELSFNGQEKDVRNLLMQRLAYVDVCDSHGLTALHFATYNVHINVVNVLLDFGANVNQLSDDGLTPLALAFLLYYGNDPQQTINTALEHRDPVILNPRTSNSTETNTMTSSKQNITNSSNNFKNDSTITDEAKFLSSLESMKINDAEKKNSYGYELTDNLRERIRDEKFRESIYSLIVLLLRRGADPSLSDWPLPVLALAVRAGDKHMVEFLLKTKAQVNCQLDPIRHASLTPLHIACGSSSKYAIDIIRLLLEYGADVNAESLSGNKEYFSLIDPLIINSNKKIDIQQQHGRTPLHIACTREATSDTLDIVRLLLEYQANPNSVCNGQTPLTLAIALGNQPLVDLLLNHETTDPSTTLGLGNGNALCTILSTFYEPGWTYTKRLQLIERLIEKNPKVFYPIRFGPKNTLGSSVDFAHFMYSADTRISQTPYHQLTTQERVIHSERKELLAYIAKRFREETPKHDEFLRLPTPTLDGHNQTSSPANLFAQSAISRAHSLLTEKTSDDNSNIRITGQFRYCATCGRSTGVRLTLCKRCQKTSFCSKACKINGWNNFHRYECLSSPTPTSPLERTIITTKSMSTKTKLPSIRSGTNQTDRSHFQNVETRFEDFTSLDRALFKDSVLAIKTPPKTNNNNSRLPPLSTAKLLRQKRLKKLGKLTGNVSSMLPISLDGIQLSWNSTYNAPENYSFN